MVSPTNTTITITRSSPAPFFGPVELPPLPSRKKLPHVSKPKPIARAASKCNPISPSPDIPKSSSSAISLTPQMKRATLFPVSPKSPFKAAASPPKSSPPALPAKPLPRAATIPTKATWLASAGPRGFAGKAGGDDFGGEAAALNGDLGDTGKRVALFICGVSEIADDEDFGMSGDGEIGLHFDAARAIGFGLETCGNFLREGSGGNSTGPKNGAGEERVMVIVVFVGDTVEGDVGYENIFHDFDAEAGD